MGLARRWLVLWYGLWQAGHLFFNLVGLVTGGAAARVLLAGGLPESAWRTMWASWAVDLGFASPVGVLFAWREWRGWPRQTSLGLASTTAATYSALLCYWVQWLHAGRMLLDRPGQWLLLLSWLPCQALFFLLIREALREKASARTAGAV